MTVEVLDESGTDVDVEQLSLLARFVLQRMRLHPRTELCVRLVDTDTIAALNAQWMDKTGSTDVLAFPIDELTPGHADGDVEDLPEGYLGDLALCPAVAAEQAPEHGHSPADEVDLLAVHGILHLLGYDHGDPDEHREMFDLQARLLAEWRQLQPRPDARNQPQASR
ncbi:MAG: rRNA maturation RNase YbeY [Actinomycetota bacterium]|nr:rRNA maturation RNase YbeY [Actinomycetota bacterium]